MSLCKGQVRPDMYGLGIRLAVYVQWLAAVVYQRIDPDSLPDIRLLGLLLSGGITIGLLHQVSQGQLDAVAIYLVLLLATGSHMFLIPVYLWRALTCCDPVWDPLAGYGEEQLRIFRHLNFTLVLVAASFGVWFYTAHLPSLDRDCLQYGFFFAKAPLHHNAAYAAANALLYLLMVLACAFEVLSRVCWPATQTQSRRRRREWLGRRGVRRRFKWMRRPHTLANLTVFAIVVAAVELPVQWNELWASNRVDTCAQVVPLLVSIGVVVRVTYVHCVEDGDEEEESAAPVADPGVPALEMPRRVPRAYAPAR